MFHFEFQPIKTTMNEEENCGEHSSLSCQNQRHFQKKEWDKLNHTE